MILGLILFFGGASHAQEVYEYTQSVRDLGRGGVRIPRDDDAGVIMYNPAMLAFIKGIRWKVASVGIGGGGTSASTNLNLFQSQSQSTGSNLSSFYGDNINISGEALTALALPHFAFAGFGSASYDAILQNPSYPTLTVNGYKDYGFAMGGAVSLGPNFAFGVNGKYVSRTGGVGVLSGSAVVNGFSLTTIQNALSRSGVGYGADVGLAWKGDSSLNPTVSVGWQDVGYTSFYTTAGNIPPPPLEDNMVLGISMHQDILGIGWAAGLEYRHIENVDVDISKKFNAGLELDLAVIDARVGVYQGWTSYGASVDLWLMSLDAAYYTVERGVVAGQLPDYRYQVGVSFEAGFDPNFNISEFGGKKRRLKQRR